MIRRLEAGQAVGMMQPDHAALGRGMAQTACANLSMPLRLALAFVKPALATPDFLAGIHSGLDAVRPGAAPVPLIGCTTPYPICSVAAETLPDAALTIVAAQEQDLTVHVGFGPDAASDPEGAVVAALAHPPIAQMIKHRPHGFLLVITPGFAVRDSDQPVGPHKDYEIIRLLAAKLGRHFPIFGGSAADDFLRCQARQLLRADVHADTLLLAFVETTLCFEYDYAYGMEPGLPGYRVEAFAASETGASDARQSGQYVSRIENRPAVEFIRECQARTPEKPLLFAVGDALNGFHFARHFAWGDRPEAVFFQRPLPLSATLYPAEASRENMLRAARFPDAARESSGSRPRPVLSLAVCGAGRPDIVSSDAGQRVDYVVEEIQALRGSLSGASSLGENEAVLAGFYAYSEHCGNYDVANVNKNFAVARLSLGNELYRDAAQLAKLSLLSQLALKLPECNTEKDIAVMVLEALNQVDYAGGMISFVNSRESKIRASYAVNGPEADCGQWKNIADSTVRELDSDDILAYVVNTAKPSSKPIVIGDCSQEDNGNQDHGNGDNGTQRARCNQEAVRAGHIQGQVIFALMDSRIGARAFGTLQIGIPLNYDPSASELEALQTFARMAAQSIASLRGRLEFQNQLQQLYALSHDAVSGEDIDKLLEDFVRLAMEKTGAECASLRLVDHAKNKLYFRALYPPDAEIWQQKRVLAARHQGIKLPPDSQTDDFEYIGQRVYHEGKPYRTQREDPQRPYNKFIEGMTSDLSVPLLLHIPDAGEDGNQDMSLHLADSPGTLRKGHFLGILTVNRNGNDFHPEDEYRLVVLARMVTASLLFANAQVLATTRNDVFRLFLHTLPSPGSVQERRAILNQAAETIRKALGCQTCSIFLENPLSSRTLYLEATTSSRLAGKVGSAMQAYGHGLTGGVAQLNMPLRLTDVTRCREGDSAYDELREDYPQFWQAGICWRNVHSEYEEDAADNNGRKQWLGVPVSVPGEARCQGVIRCTAWHSAENFTEEDEKLLMAIAEWLAQWLTLLQHQSDFSETKDRLLAFVSHELRTPLTSVKNNAEMLLSPMYGDLDKKHKQMVSRLHQRSIEALEMVSNMLDHARFNAGSLPHRPRYLKVKTLLDQITKEFYDTCEARHITLTSSADLRDGMMYADPAQAKSIVQNLVSNAVKYTPDAGTITIRAEVSSQGCHISVRDTGVGLTPEDAERIFDPFFRVKTTRRATVPGIGLGLSLVREQIERHGGSVTVNSEIGKFTEFIALFPPGKTPARRFPASAKRSRKGD